MPTRKRLRGRKAVNCELGLRLLRGFGPEGSYLIRKARNGAMPGRLGRKSDPKHKQGPSLRKNGNKNGYDDYDDNYCDDRNPTPWGSRVRSISRAPEAPARTRPRGAAKTAQAVPGESAVGQRRQDNAREFSLQASPSCAACSSFDLDTTSFASRCADSAAFFCDGLWIFFGGPRLRPIGTGLPARDLGPPKGRREVSWLKHGAFYEFVADPPYFFFVHVPCGGHRPVSVREISFFSTFFYADPNSLDSSGVT